MDIRIQGSKHRCRHVGHKNQWPSLGTIECGLQPRQLPRLFLHLFAQLDSLALFLLESHCNAVKEKQKLCQFRLASRRLFEPHILYPQKSLTTNRLAESYVQQKKMKIIYLLLVPITLSLKLIKKNQVFVTCLSTRHSSHVSSAGAASPPY